MPIATAFTTRFGLRHPVALAPMGNVSGGALAAAVSRAGGLGIIGGGYCNRDWIARELEAAGDAEIGIGFITWSLAGNPDVLDVALERPLKCVFLSFGDLQPFAAKIKARGVPLIAQIQTLEQARIAAAEGADVIVAQGTEAGGHGASRATLPLVPAVVDALPDLPVLAAGGIADGRGLAAALMLGAAGVVCGTVFYAAAEALSHPRAKEAAVAANGDQTERGAVFDIARGIDWPSNWNLRALRNSFSERWKGNLQELRRSNREKERYAEAAAAGDTGTAVVIVGEAVDLVRAVEPAAAILGRMTDRAEALLRAAPDRLSSENARKP